MSQPRLVRDPPLPRGCSSLGTFSSIHQARAAHYTLLKAPLSLILFLLWSYQLLLFFLMSKGWTASVFNYGHFLAPSLGPVLPKVQSYVYHLHDFFFRLHDF